MRSNIFILFSSAIFTLGCASNEETSTEVKPPIQTETIKEVEKNDTQQLVLEARKFIGEEYTGSVLDSIKSIHGELKVDGSMSNLDELYARATKTGLIFVVDNNSYKITEVLPPMPKSK